MSIFHLDNKTKLLNIGLEGPTEIVLWNFNNLKKFNQNF